MIKVRLHDGGTREIRRLMTGVPVLILLLLLITCLAQDLSAQIPQSPNATNADGKREGQWTIYLGDSWDDIVSDSILAKYYLILTYKDGVPVGKAGTFHISGEKEWEGSLTAYPPFTPTDGEQICYYKNGKMSQKMTYLNGKIEGQMLDYYDDGKKKAESNFKDGVLEGAMIQYHPNEQKSMEVMWKAGKRDGIQTMYYESGKKRGEVPYKDGKENGIARFFYEDGKKQGEISLKEGKRDGPSRTWTPLGELKEEVFFKDGKKMDSK